MWRVDQVFLSYSGSRIRVVASLVSDHQGLRNVEVIAPTEDPLEAVRFAARFVASPGNVHRAWGARVRWARARAENAQEDLARDRALEAAFVDAFEDTLDQIRDQLR
nr:hypothetical protein [Deinobacterium chartae]